jgi:hypothetical protein
LVVSREALSDDLFSHHFAKAPNAFTAWLALSREVLFSQSTIQLNHYVERSP